MQKHLEWSRRLGETACLVGNNQVSMELTPAEQVRIPENRFQSAPTLTKIDWPEYRTGNSSMARRLCEQAGGFDDALKAAEDTEIAARLADLAVQFYYVPEIKAVHHHPLDLNGFFTKAALYGQAAACWYQKAPAHRRLLTYRYGVYARELSWYKKMKYILRFLFINRYTVAGIIIFGKRLKPVLSEKLYRIVFQYHTRQAFKQQIAR
ncbi:MAG: hypothetical protein U5R06_09960 [candidate division KSB1 bacterium]|nr:hypothetical protein [candidate division KSB1 bacterium]